MRYAIKDFRGKFTGPVSTPSRWNGVRGFHLLSQEELKSHGWYPCTVENESYDDETQVRTGPTFTFDENSETVTATYTVKDKPLNTVKKYFGGLINDERNAFINGGITFQDVRYQTRQDDRENLLGTVTLAQIALSQGKSPTDVYWHDGAEPFFWIAEDNSQHIMDAITVITFGKAMAEHKHYWICKARHFKDQIENAESTQQVIDIYNQWNGQDSYEETVE